MKLFMKIGFLFILLNMSSFGSNPEEWNGKISDAIRMKIGVETKKEILEKWGEPDPNIPKEIRDLGIIQYLYTGGLKLPRGVAPSIRFKFNKEDKLIEVAIGFAYGPKPG